VAQCVKNLPAMQEMQEIWVRFLGSGTSPGGEHGNPFQYSCLENSMDRGAWRATVHGVTKSHDRSDWVPVHTSALTLWVLVSQCCVSFSCTTKWFNDTYIHVSAAAAAAKSLQSCPTLCDPIDGNPPGSPVPGILQARTLERVTISFSNAWKWKVKGKSLSHVRLLATPWTAAY